MIECAINTHTNTFIQDDTKSLQWSHNSYKAKYNTHSHLTTLLCLCLCMKSPYSLDWIPCSRHTYSPNYYRCNQDITSVTHIHLPNYSVICALFVLCAHSLWPHLFTLHLLHPSCINPSPNWVASSFDSFYYMYAPMRWDKQSHLLVFPKTIPHLPHRCVSSSIQSDPALSKWVHMCYLVGYCTIWWRFQRLFISS